MIDPFQINTPEALAGLFGPVSPAAMLKESPTLTPQYREMVAASPFALIGTTGPNGLDISPRGDAPGFVHAVNERTLLLPERPGNNRIESLRNLLHDSRLALIFLIPGVGETLRIRGRGRITTDPELLQRFSVGAALPRCVIRVEVDCVFFQCARAIRRSRLWDPALPATLPPVPSAGSMLKPLMAEGFDASAYDQGLPDRQQNSLY